MTAHPQRRTLAQWRAVAAGGAQRSLADMRRDLFGTVHAAGPAPRNPMRRGRARYLDFYSHRRTPSRRELTARRRQLLAAPVWADAGMRTLYGNLLRGVLLDLARLGRVLGRFAVRLGDGRRPCAAERQRADWLASRFRMSEVRAILPPRLRVAAESVAAPGAPHASAAAVPCH